MGIVDDLLAMQKTLADKRSEWESAWREVVEVSMPYASRRFDRGGGGVLGMSGQSQKPTARDRGRELYDPSAAWAGDRLTAGMESLTIPRSQKWHGFGLDDPFAPDPSDVEEEWLDRLRDYHFGARYDAKSNFALAHQKAIRSTCMLGTGITYLEENIGRRGVDPVKVPFFYRSVPLIDCYLGIDPYDDPDKCIQVTEMTARAAGNYFDRDGDKLSTTLQTAIEKTPDESFTFMHVVLPRGEVTDYKNKNRAMPYASFWCEIEAKQLIRSSGFFTFPYSVMWWDQMENSPYGQSPIMASMSEIKMLQVMGKASIQAAQQMVKPPLATAPGLYNHRLNLNAGAINPGYMDEQGRMKVAPILTGANPSFAENLIETKRAGLRSALYVDMFQILVQNPQMTATEALIRSNEKGELLGPAGAKIESGIARSIEREVDIVQRKGAFEQGSPLAPPQSLVGKNVGVKFTGPLSRLRRTQELQGVDRVMSTALAIAQYDPQALRRIDTDETLEITREISGAPRKMFRTDEEMAQDRQATAQQQEQAAALQATEALAGAAGKATPAIQALQQAQAA